MNYLCDVLLQRSGGDSVDVLMCRSAEGIPFCCCHKNAILRCGRGTDRRGSLYLALSVLAGLCLEYVESADSSRYSCLHQVRNSASQTLVAALLLWDGK